MGVLKQFEAGLLQVAVYETRAELGVAAARAVVDRVNAVLREKAEVNMVFASAPSQNEFLAGLLASADMPWDRVNAFHMDEYIGLAADAPQGFGNFIRDRLWGRVPLRSANYIDGNAASLAEECHRYAALLAQHPIDFVCFGIGENGHLAFNDPDVADFNDPQPVKVVELDMMCRRQQVNDGCFRSLEEVPTHALTLTIPALAAGRYLYGMVPGKTKADAIHGTIHSSIDERCPATILRTHRSAWLFADRDSAARVL